MIVFFGEISKMSRTAISNKPKSYLEPELIVLETNLKNKKIRYKFNYSPFLTQDDYDKTDSFLENTYSIDEILPLSTIVAQLREKINLTYWCILRYCHIWFYENNIKDIVDIEFERYKNKFIDNFCCPIICYLDASTNLQDINVVKNRLNITIQNIIRDCHYKGFSTADQVLYEKKNITPLEPNTKISVTDIRERQVLTEYGKTVEQLVFNAIYLEFYSFLKDKEKQSDIEEVDQSPNTGKLKKNFTPLTEKEICTFFKTNLVDTDYIAEKELKRFIKQAFELGKAPTSYIKISSSQDKVITRRKVLEIFNKFFVKCNSPHGKQRDYCNLLTYFEGFQSKSLYKSWRKNHLSKQKIKK